LDGLSVDLVFGGVGLASPPEPDADPASFAAAGFDAESDPVDPSELEPDPEPESELAPSLLPDAGLGEE
jgi:hypothetical protein